MSFGMKEMKYRSSSHFNSQQTLTKPNNSPWSQFTTNPKKTKNSYLHKEETTKKKGEKTNLYACNWNPKSQQNPQTTSTS